MTCREREERKRTSPGTLITAERWIDTSNTSLQLSPSRSMMMNECAHTDRVSLRLPQLTATSSTSAQNQTTRPVVQDAHSTTIVSSSSTASITTTTTTSTTTITAVEPPRPLIQTTKTVAVAVAITFCRRKLRRPLQTLQITKWPTTTTTMRRKGTTEKAQKRRRR